MPASFAAVLDSRPDAGCDLVSGARARWRPGRAVLSRDECHTQTFQNIVGLGGQLGLKDWTWDLYGSHGESQIDNQVFQGTVVNARYAQLMARAELDGQNFVDPNNGTLACTSGISPFILSGEYQCGLLQLPHRQDELRHRPEAGRHRGLCDRQPVRLAGRRFQDGGRCGLSSEYVPVCGRQLAAANVGAFGHRSVPVLSSIAGFQLRSRTPAPRMCGRWVRRR